MTYEALKQAAAGYPAAVVTLNYQDSDFLPLKALQTLKANGEKALLLTGKGAANHARHSLIAAKITETLTYRKGLLTRTSTAGSETAKADLSKVVNEKLQALKVRKLADQPPFVGGIAGYFSYEYAQVAKPGLTLTAKDPDKLPDADLFVVTQVICYDHQNQTVTLTQLVPTADLTEAVYQGALKKLTALKARLQTANTQPAPKAPRLLTPITPEFDLETFTEKVKQTQVHIYAGDIFQLILSNQQHSKLSGSLLGAADEMFAQNPTPYQFYFHDGDYEALGASPETLIAQHGQKLFTFPLAGTRRRGKTPEEDDKMAYELQHSEKECAEHNMLIDLGRNDLGAISEFGTVKVTRTRALLKFANVMHLGSVVESRIKKGSSPMAVIQSALPAGTLAGAPKQSAMQIIDELEPTKRGLYGGTIGYFDATGDLDFCIGIRLCYRKGENLTVQSGAGIVADSQPRLEYKEFTNKISTIKSSLEAAADADSNR